MDEIERKTMQDIKNYVKSLDTPENEVYQQNSLLIMSCFSKAIEFIEQNAKLRQTAISGSNFTLYSVCCNEEPHHRKKDDVEYYECPYCKEECEVEWVEDEFPDYCH